MSFETNPSEETEHDLCDRTIDHLKQKIIELEAENRAINASNNKLRYEAADYKMRVLSLECEAEALRKAVADHGDTIAENIKVLEDEILPRVQALEAENERLKPLAEVGELVNRLPELKRPGSEYVCLRFDLSPVCDPREFWDVIWLDLDMAAESYTRCNKSALEALREAFGEEKQ